MLCRCGATFKGESEMANFGLLHMEGRIGVATNTNPLTFVGTIQAEEMSVCFIVIGVSAVSAGINGGNPAVVAFQTTFDDGETWDDIVGTTIENITGTGKFFTYLTSGVVKIAPQIRIVVTPPAGQTVTISYVKKTRATETVVFRAPVSGGGGAGEDVEPVLGNAQKVIAGNLTAAVGVSYMMGWDGTQHREVALSPTGDVSISLGTITQNVAVRNRYATTAVTTGAWVQLIASTAFTIKEWSVFDSSGQTLEIGIGAGGAETRLFLIPPGGMPNFSLNVAAGTRISIRAVSANATSGELVLQGRG